MIFLHFTFNLCNLDLLNWVFFLHCSFFRCLLNWCHECLGLQCWRFHFLNGWLFNGSRSMCNEFLLCNRGCRLLLLLHRCYFKQCILLHGCNYSFFKQRSLLDRCLLCGSGNLPNLSLTCNKFLLRNLRCCLLFNGRLLVHQCFFNGRVLHDRSILLHEFNDSLVFLCFTFNHGKLDLLNQAFFLHCTFFMCVLNWCGEFLGLQCWRFHFLNGGLFCRSGNLLNLSLRRHEFLLHNSRCRFLFKGSLLLH